MDDSGHEFLAVFKIDPKSKDFVTFEQFLSVNRALFDNLCECYLHWYLNENIDSTCDSVVMSTVPAGYSSRPGTFLLPGHPSHVTEDRIREMNPGLTDIETAELWTEVNTYFGRDASEITFLIRWHRISTSEEQGDIIDG